MADHDGPQRPGGWREVYTDADGGAYVEPTPGAGPRHHDDLRLTPADVEAKAAEGDPGAELATMAGTPGYDQPGPGAPHGFLVVGRTMILGVYGPGEAPRAHEQASIARASVYALPLIADYTAGWTTPDGG